MTAPRRTGEPHAAYDELAAGYAMRALEPEEEQIFLAHLAGCTRCARSLARHEETLGHLAYLVEPAEPPAALFQAIRAQVLADGSPAAFPAPPGPLAAARARRLRRPLLPGRRAMSWTGAAAAVALVVALAGWNLTLHRQHTEDAVVASRAAAAARLIESAPTHTVPLTGPDQHVQAVAVLRGDRVALVVDRLPRNDPAGTTYVLWGRDRLGGVRALGTFDVRQPGVQVVSDGMPLPGDATPLAGLAITRERGRVAPAGTSQPFLATGTVSG